MLEVNPGIVLRVAAEDKLQTVLVLGYDANNAFYAACSSYDKETALTLVKLFETKLLRGDFDAQD